MEIEKTELEKVFNQFLNYVVKESKAKAPKTFGTLAKSIKSTGIKESQNSISGGIVAADYLPFIDQGVSGIKKKYNTPFSYKSKGGKTGLKGMPPPSAFDKWNVKKGRAGRNEKGQFVSRQQLNFATAVSVFNYGIKPRRFFTTPFEQAFNDIPDNIVEAYGLDVDNFLEFILKE